MQQQQKQQQMQQQQEMHVTSKSTSYIQQNNVTTNSLYGLKAKFLISLLLVIVPWGIYFLRECYAVVLERQNARPDFRYPMFSDFYVSFYVVVLLCVLRLLSVKYIFTSLGDALIPLNKYSEEERKSRITRFAHVCFKSIWFYGVVGVGFYYMRNQPWWPWQLGGIGDTAEAWSLDFPFQEIPMELRIYYLISFGYHAHSLVFHVAMEHRNDFLELFLHHIVTLFLITFSYLLSYHRIGSMVLFVHDLPDVFVYSCKVWVDTKYTAVTLTFYTSLVITWFMIRLVIYPAVVIRSSIFESYSRLEAVVPSGHLHGRHLLNVMLCILYLLHLYWFYLFLLMGINFLKKGKTEDFVEKIEGKKALNGKSEKVE